MSKYNVIWFDDEFDTLDLIRESAMLNGIVLHGYSNAMEGIAELNQNLVFYDAAIVDGKFFQKPGQSHDSIDDMALFNVALAIEKLNHIKVLPWFILSGQASFTKEKNQYAAGFKDNKVYDKNYDENVLALWNDLKKEADSQPETQIRFQHAEAFEMCSKHLGDGTANNLLTAMLISDYRRSLPNEEVKDSFTRLRKIIEVLFSHLNKKSIIPDQVFNNTGWINKCSMYLEGTHPDYIIAKDVIHPTTAYLLKQFLNITQDSSHGLPERLKLANDEFIQLNQTNYLYRSTVYQLLDILVWFKNFLDKYNSESVGRIWTRREAIACNDGEWQQGIITRIAQNGYGTFQPDDGSPSLSIIPKFVNEFALQEKDIILVATEESNDKQKLHIKAIKKI